MSKTKPDSNSQQPASPGSRTLPGRTLDQPALPILPETAGPASRALTAAQFQGLAEVPPELEWFANIRNEKTRRAYQQDVKDFTAFAAIEAIGGPGGPLYRLIGLERFKADVNTEILDRVSDLSLSLSYWDRVA